MAQKYGRTLTKHRKVKKGHGWTKLERIKTDCIWVNLKNVVQPFSNLHEFISNVIYTQLEIILSCYVAVILRMRDSCSANLY